MKTLLTGDRPTGALHLGHLMGSLRSRVALQKDYATFILIADIQALTDNFARPEEVKNNVLELMADYLAVGLDPQHAHIFLQSQVRALPELTTYLANLISLDFLRHNPTLKTELVQKKINNLGFFSYPVSQAADILAFQAELVPVGADQAPILELTNKLAKTFNRLYRPEFFPEVKPLFTEVSRLQGLDGVQKMSKSLGNALFLKDEIDVIRKKVNKMYTDPLHIHVEDPGHLEGNVVIYYLDVFDPDQTELAELKARYCAGGVADSLLKQRLVEVLESVIAPIRTRRHQFSQDPAYLKTVLRAGTEAANARAEVTMKTVREIFSLNLRP